MTTHELERYLHEHIPLSRAMGVVVDAASGEEVLLRAPLAPNINHRDTVFGGSASAICILAAWSLVHVRLRLESIDARIVIHRNAMEYIAPVAGEFTARARSGDTTDWQRFARMLARKGKGRIEVAATLEHAAGVAGRLYGEFVALKSLA